MDEWKNEWMDEWMDEWKNEWMDEWKNKWENGIEYFVREKILSDGGIVRNKKTIKEDSKRGGVERGGGGMDGKKDEPTKKGIKWWMDGRMSHEGYKVMYGKIDG